MLFFLISGKGEPAPKIALKLVYSITYSIVASALEVGFDKGKIIGQNPSFQLLISSKISLENKPGVAVKPINIWGFSYFIIVKRLALSNSPFYYANGKSVKSIPYQDQVIKPSISKIKKSLYALSTFAPDFILYLYNILATPRPAEPAPAIAIFSFFKLYKG